MAGGDVFAPVRWKHLDLRDPQLGVATEVRRRHARRPPRRRGAWRSSSPSRPTARAASRPTPSRSFPATTPRSPSPPPTATPPAPPSPSATSIRASPPPDHQERHDDRLLLPALLLAQLPAARRHPEDASPPPATSSVEGYGALYADAAKVAELNEHLAASGLKMPTGHFGLDMLENEPDRVLEIAKAVGIETIYCPYLLPRPAPRQPARAGTPSASGCRRPARRYRDAGLGFGWHNHDFEFRRPPTARCRRPRSSRAAPTSNGRPTSPG